MKNVRRFLIVLTVVAVTALLFAACDNTPAAKDTYTVGVIQLAPHPALDAATEGFKQALIDKLGEDKVSFDVQNAQGESNTCVTIANSFVSKKVDLIMANATGALQAAANATLDIPILGTSVTEYGVALGIENFSGTVGGNISGTSDLASLDQQAQMILDFFPDTKTVGLFYCSAEPNSVYQVAKVREYLEAKDIVCTDYKFADSNDVAQVAAKAAAENDVLYVPTDNIAANCAASIDNIVRPTGTPIIAGEAGICGGCGVATLSISYFDLGYKTGEMAADILTGAKKIEEMPIAYADKSEKKFNAEICADLGITPPEGYTAIEE